MPDTAMDALERIREARSAGEVIGGTREDFAGSPEMFAAEFGLSSEPGTYHVISPAEAIALLAAVIHRDMAYASEIVPKALALHLASDFVGQFEPRVTRFHTNGAYGLPRADPDVGPGWQPATAATFDTGVLALGRPVSACLWFTDED